MKKFIISAMAVLALSLSAVGLAACGPQDGDTNDGHEHTLVKHAAVEKTCTEAGSKLYWECSDCGKLYLDEQATSETTAEAVVVAAGHTEELLLGKAATCTEKGLTEGSKCSVCGETLVAQEEIAIDPEAHNYELKSNEDEHWYECACGEEKDHEAHKGGTATSTKRAECEVCGEEYGDYGEGGDDPVENPPADETKYTGVATKFTAELGLVTLTGSAQKESGYGTNGTFIGGITSGSTITYTIESTYAGNVGLSLAAAGQDTDWGGVIVGAFSVYVNGSEEALTTINVGTNGWTNFTEIFIGKAELVEGLNTIVLVAGETTNAHVNVDYLLIAPPASTAYDGVETRYGAELATYEDCELQENGAGADGYIFSNMQENTSKVSYTINSSAEELVEVYVSVAGGSDPQEWNGWGPTAPQVEAFEVYVNGVSLGKFDVGTNGWTNFSDIFVGYVSFSEGEITIEICAVNAGYNLNCLRIAPANVYSGSEMKIGAGSATVQGGSVEGNGEGFDGHIVGGLSDGNNSVVTFSVYSSIEQSVSLFASVAGGTFDGINWDAPATTGSIEVVVNGTSVGTFNFQTGGWLDFTEFLACTVSLTAGQNTIEFHVTGGNANLNYLKIAPATV